MSEAGAAQEPRASARPFRDEGLIALTTRRPVAVSMIVLTVIIFGVIGFQRLPRNLMPDISYPTITVRTEYPGASPSDVEMRVSKRLEEVLSQVRNLRRVSSISRAEISDVILELSWNASMGLATMDVREKVEQAQLPDGLPKPTILRYDPTLDPILQLGLVAKGAGTSGPDAQDLIELRILAEDLLERELETIDGVAAVQVRGGYEREMRIEVSEPQLRTRGLSMALISQRLREENLNQASGQLYEGDQAYVVRTVNEFRDIEEVRDIILRREGAVPIRLRDVAVVEWSAREPEVLTRVGGAPCVKIEVYKEADANIVEVATRVRNRVFGTPAERKRLAELEAAARRGTPPAGAGAPAPPGGPGASAEQGAPNFLASRLGPGKDVVVMSDQSVFIRTALDDVRSTAVSGGLLAILVLYVFLRNGWFTLAVGLSIPISIVATFVVMYLFGVSLNLMSLGGLALGIGMLVDNSIVVLESIFRCREEGDEPRVAAVRGTQQVAAAVAASTLTTVAVFFPIVFVEGVAGQIFRDQALTVVISLLASLLVALYLIPVCVGRTAPRLLEESPAGAETRTARGAVEELRERVKRLNWSWWNTPILALAVLYMGISCATQCLLAWISWLLGHSVQVGARQVARAARWTGGFTARGSNGFFRAWEALFDTFLRCYEQLLRAALRHRGLVLLAVLAAAGASLWLHGKLGYELIPEVHQGEFTIDVRLPVGTRIERTDEVLRPVEEKLLAAARLEGVESVTSTVGVEKSSIRAGDEGEHSARILVRVPPGSRLIESEERIKEKFRQVLEGEPELASYKFENPVLFSFKTPVEVEVKGYNLEELKRVTRGIEEGLKGLPRLKDVKSTARSGFPEVHLKLDREALARYGLSVASVGDAIRQKIQGEVPTYFNEGDRRVGLRVRLLEEDRRSLEDLAGLVVNPGAPVPLKLSDVVPGGRLEVSEGPAEIRRIGQQRAAVVTANVVGVDLGNTTRSVAGVMDGVRRPPGFLVGFGGQKEEMDQSLRSLGQALILAVFLVYVVMAVQFESVIQPLIILLSVPLALVALPPALLLFKMSVSIVVLIGMIILAGIVVNNAIVLVDHVNFLRGSGLSLTECLVDAGKVRMRPILMTTLTTVLGLLPLTGVFSPLANLFAGIPLLPDLLGTGEGAEIRSPLAVTVMCGLSASTALTLIVIPVVYSLVKGRRRRGGQPETLHGD